MSYKYDNDNRVRTSAGGGLGLGSVLGVVFIVLKLVGVIDWPWIWVLAPFWIGFILALAIFIITFIGIIITFIGIIITFSIKGWWD